jgi:hypothetical protein
MFYTCFAFFFGAPQNWMNLRVRKMLCWHKIFWRWNQTAAKLHHSNAPSVLASTVPDLPALNIFGKKMLTSNCL